MSIVTLKKKVKTQYDNMSVDSKNGFSLNGTRRNQGFVGQSVISRSLSRTLCNGSVPRGHGGCCGTFPIKPIIQSGVNYLNDPKIVKMSVMNTKGMIETQYSCVPPRVCPIVNDLVQADNIITTYSDSKYWTMGEKFYSSTIGISNNINNIYIIDLIAGTGRFLNYSKDNGKTFSQISNNTKDAIYIQDGINSICCDETGKYVYIGNRNDFYYSSNSLNTITKVVVNIDSPSVSSVSCSTDGKNVVYINSTQIFISYNYGVNFTPLPTTINYESVAISPDGTKIVARKSNGVFVFTFNITTSTWSSAIQISNPSATNTNFGNISVTNNLTILLTTYGNGNVYIYSNNQWIKTSCPSGNYYNSSMSNDGKVMLACDNNGKKAYYSVNSGVDWSFLTNFTTNLDSSVPCGVTRDGKYICIGNGDNTSTENSIMFFLLGNKTNIIKFSKGKYSNVVKPDSNNHLNNQQQYIERLVNKVNSCFETKDKNLESKCINDCPKYFKTNYIHKWKTIFDDSTKTIYKSQNEYLTNVKSICINNDMVPAPKKNLGTPFSCSNVK